MSQELLYTSAPSGLNPTDQGFCTVVCTQGMPRNLKEFLESLSGYRQAEKPPHPANFSHLIHSIGGKRYSVLSRVGDYGKDYSGRTNKLAHHIALTMDELPPSGPAALLGTSLFKASWDGQTRSEASGPLLPSASAHQGPCRAWEAITGDAGWAGVLAESAADGSHRPMYVIFSQGQSVLPLIAEALSILPREHAWTTSFSTYFTKLPAGIDCLWRFVLEGSPEAQQARIASHGRTIDLVDLQKTRRRAPEGNPFVIAARAGRVADSQPATSSGGTFAPSAPSPLATATVATHDAPAPPSPFGTTAPASPFAKPFREDKAPSKLPYILGGAALVAVIGVGVLVYSMMTKDIPTTTSFASDSNRPKERKTQTASQLSQDAFLSIKEQQELDAQAKRQAAKTVVQPVQVKQEEKKPVAVSTPMEKKVEIQGPWDRTLLTKGGFLEIPFHAANIAGVFVSERVPLAEIHAEPSRIDLKIHSTNDDPSTDKENDKKKENVSTDQFVIKVEDAETDEGPVRNWIVQQPVRNQVTLLIDRREKLGTFTLANQEFSFLWTKEPLSKSVKPNSLLYCVLELSHGDQSHKFRLSQPSATDPAKYDLAGRGQQLYLENRSNAVKDPKSLYLDFELHGITPQPFAKRRMKVDELVKFSTQKPNIKLGDPTIEFEIQFKYDNKGPHLVFDACTKRTQLAPLTAMALQQIHAVPSVSVRESTFVTYFDKIRKDAKGDIAKIRRTQAYREGVLKLPELNQKLASKESAAASEPDKKKREELNEEIGKLKTIINVVNEVIKREKVLEDLIVWADDMEPFFQELQKTARVEYTLYTEIQGEKIILARTESLGTENRSDEQNPKPANPEKSSDKSGKENKERKTEAKSDPPAPKKPQDTGDAGKQDGDRPKRDKPKEDR